MNIYFTVIEEEIWADDVEPLAHVGIEFTSGPFRGVILNGAMIGLSVKNDTTIFQVRWSWTPKQRPPDEKIILNGLINRAVFRELETEILAAFHRWDKALLARVKREDQFLAQTKAAATGRE